MIYEANGIRVVTIEGYLPRIAEQLGGLRRELSQRDSGEPVDPTALQRIIDSPDSDVLAAYKINENGATGLNAKIVGMGVLSLVRGVRRSYTQLEEFVVDPKLQGNGVGGVMWEAFGHWATDKGTSEIRLQTEPETRPGAARFYEHVGALPVSDKVTYSYQVGA